MKYSDVFMTWLRAEGYTHCFYLSGGNVMHLLESASQNFECIPFVHEVSAGIAADYFNEVSDGNSRAFVLVTAGPGLTNIVTAIAGAWTESRELLVIGGQAKVSDLSRSKYRQIGFQEIDGKSLCQGITNQKYETLSCD
jgi:acetolactate synthase-1/2/3 large subunit